MVETANSSYLVPPSTVRNDEEQLTAAKQAGERATDKQDEKHTTHIVHVELLGTVLASALL